MNLDKVNHLCVSDLMALQVAVNNRVEQVKSDAFNALLHDEPCEGFALKAGRVSRVIADMDKYTHILQKNLGDRAYKVTPIALTVAETLVKNQFDEEDACSILGELADTYGTKTSPPSLIYTGEFE